MVEATMKVPQWMPHFHPLRTPMVLGTIIAGLVLLYLQLTSIH